MEVSIVVPTYNGGKKIGSLLNALSLQTFREFELIVVIDGSLDDTLSVTNNYTSKEHKIKIVQQPNGGRSKARNRGAKEAVGSLLIFYDDDVAPAPDSVLKHFEFHKKYQLAILAGNPDELYSIQKTDIQNYKAWLCKRWTKEFTETINQLTLSRFFLAAANMSVPREVFLKLNGFDENLTDAEDYEFALRSLEQNVHLYFDKSNVAIHEDPITCVNYILRQRQYSSAQHKLFGLHPKRIRSEEKSDLFRRAIYRLFAFRFWPNLIDGSKLLKYLPRNIRYKLYDLVIHSLGKEYKNVTIN
jgi:glycosyltransferase involved in cell wall biosynthesis